MLFGYGLRGAPLTNSLGRVHDWIDGRTFTGTGKPPVSFYQVEGRHDKQGPLDEHSSVATAAPIVALTLLLVVGAIALGALRAHAHEIPHLS